MTKPRIGLALGSGSARGWSHIGVIGALEEAGIEADVVCGCSIGALVGAAYVRGRLPALENWALGLKWRDIVGMLDVRLVGGGLINGRIIAGSLKRLGLDGMIEDCPKPFAAVATDLATGREVWLERGPIGDAVRASMSLPGIFAPARIGDAWMVDGGLVNPVPVSTCRALGADIIIAVNLNGDLVGRRSISTEKRARLMQPETVNRLISRLPNDIRDQVSGLAGRLLQSGPATPSYFDVLANSINIMQDQITRTRLAGEPPHHLVLPRLAGFGLMEFNRAQEAIEEGRAAVRHSLPALRKVLATTDH